MRNEALANPRVLEWARRMTGLETGSAARKAGVKPERLALWESGARRPTITQLRKLADIYRRPLGVFFLEQAPPDEVAPADFRRLQPDAVGTLSPELRLAIRTARTRREAALELFEDLGGDPPGFRFRGGLSDDPERVGEKIRAALGIAVPLPQGDPRIAFNLWRSGAESVGILVFQAQRIDVDEMRGFSISEHPLPTVTLNIKDAYVGRIFSLLHELAHIVLSRSGLCLLDEDHPSVDAQRVEIFANHVAGAAMMPAASLLEEPETPRRPQDQISDRALETLAARYAASPEAVLRRLVILARASSSFYTRKRREYQKRYEALRKQKAKQGRPSRASLAIARGGRLFTSLVLEAYDEKRITARDVAELVGERLKHLERIRSVLQSATGDAERG